MFLKFEQVQFTARCSCSAKLKTETWFPIRIVDYNQTFSFRLTLVLLNPDILCFANSVDPDQLASEEANWSGSALFAIKYVNF